MFATLDAIKGQPELAKFQFRATNRWMGGTHNRSHIKEFDGAGQVHRTDLPGWDVDAGEPAILLGKDEGPNPAEYLLHALAACLTTSLVCVAAARGVRLIEVESTLEGDLNAQGALGLDDDYRNGFEQIKVSFRVKADAPEEKVREVVRRAASRSVVFDSINAGVPVSVDVTVA
jgi:uncharacterized OsmC-like protein